MEELNFNKQMPYKVSDEQIGALCERIRNNTTHKTQRRFYAIRPLRVATLTAVAAVVVAGVILIYDKQDVAMPEEMRLETVLANTSDEVIAKVADNNYDDILFNQDI